MNPDRWTLKTHQTFADAQALAQRRGHQELSEEHLLAALISKEGGIIGEVLKKAGTDPKAVSSEIDRVLSKQPQAGGRLYASPDVEKTMVKAEDRMKAMKDEFVSVEHVLLGLMDNGGGAAKLLARLDLTPDKALAALVSVRGSQRVTSQDPET